MANYSSKLLLIVCRLPMLHTGYFAFGPGLTLEQFRNIIVHILGSRPKYYSNKTPGRLLFHVRAGPGGVMMREC